MFIEEIKIMMHRFCQGNQEISCCINSKSTKFLRILYQWHTVSMAWKEQRRYIIQEGWQTFKMLLEVTRQLSSKHMQASMNKEGWLEGLCEHSKKYNKYTSENREQSWETQEIVSRHWTIVYQWFLFSSLSFFPFWKCDAYTCCCTLTWSINPGLCV